MTTLTRNNVVETARSFLGVPFRHGGRTERGLDCGGLPFAVAWGLGIDVEDYNNYRIVPSGREMERVLGDRCERIHKNNIGPGDIALFLFEGETIPHHVGIIGEKNGRLTLIHALLKNRKVIEHTLDDGWRKRMLRGYRLPGVE